MKCRSFCTLNQAVGIYHGVTSDGIPIEDSSAVELICVTAACGGKWTSWQDPQLKEWVEGNTSVVTLALSRKLIIPRVQQYFTPDAHCMCSWMCNKAMEWYCWGLIILLGECVIHLCNTDQHYLSPWHTLTDLPSVGWCLARPWPWGHTVYSSHMMLHHQRNPTPHLFNVKYFFLPNLIFQINQTDSSYIMSQCLEGQSPNWGYFLSLLSFIILKTLKIVQQLRINFSFLKYLKIWNVGAELIQSKINSFCLLSLKVAWWDK